MAATRLRSVRQKLLLMVLVVNFFTLLTAGGALLSAVRWSYLPAFFTSLTIGTTPDFGVFNAFLYGLAVATARSARVG